MQLSDLTIEVRDVNLVRKGQITEQYMDMKLEPTYLAPGAWEVKLPSDHPMAAVLRAPGSGIIATHVDPAAGVLLSGPSLSPVVAADRDDPDGTSVFTGTTDDVLLWRRIAYPTPSTADVTQQVAAYDVRSGIAETVMRAYVNANLGPGAPAARRVAGLTLAPDLLRGISVNYSARFERVGDLLASIATVAGLGFRIVQVGAGLEFQVYDPTDKSDLIRLDMANGTLVAQSVESSAPTLTRAIVAGQGVGEDRTLVEVVTLKPSDETDFGRFGRIEGFIDQRNTDDPVELTQSGTEAILEGASGLAVRAVPGDDTTMAYPTDWGLGDVLGLVVDDQEGSAQVTKATILINASVGVTVGASIGAVQGWDPQAPVRQELKAQDARLSNLERNLESSTSTVMPTGTNLNTMTRDGSWDVDTQALANTLTNLPSTYLGNLRAGSLGTLRVHVTPTRVVQEFTSLLTLGGRPMGLLFRRIRSGDGVTWGPWRLEEPPVPVYSEAEQQALAGLVQPNRDRPLRVTRIDTFPVEAVTFNGNSWYATTYGSNGTVQASSPMWQNITLAAPFANYAAGFLRCQYGRTQDGIVMLRGLFSSATAWNTGTPSGYLFTLPVGYRPAGKRIFLVAGAGGSGDAAGRIDVLENGEVYLRAIVGLANGVALPFCSLSNITFPSADAAPEAAWTTLAPMNGFYQYSTVDPTWPNAGYWVDSLGRYWLRGMLGRASLPGADTIMCNLPAAAATYQRIHLGGQGSAGFCAFHFDGTPAGTAGAVPGALYWKTGSGGATWIHLPTSPILPMATFPESVWSAFTLGAGWSNYGTASFPGGAAHRAPDGMVHMRGLLQGGPTGVITPLTVGFGASPLGTQLLGGMAANGFARQDVSNANLVGGAGATSWRTMDGLLWLQEA